MEWQTGTYNLPKPNHKGQTSIQLDPIEFIDRIATLIPIPHRHRRHYFGAFAPHSPLRKLVALNAKHRPEHFITPHLQQIADKTRKASFEWAALIANIYEVDPLICSRCGGRVKILGFVTHRIEILRILQDTGWPVEFHEFDPPHLHPEYNESQLLSNTADGFPEIENQEWSEECHNCNHRRMTGEHRTLVPDKEDQEASPLSLATVRKLLRSTTRRRSLYRPTKRMGLVFHSQHTAFFLVRDSEEYCFKEFKNTSKMGLQSSCSIICHQKISFYF
jgi:hypothetical protein